MLNKPNAIQPFVPENGHYIIGQFGNNLHTLHLSLVRIYATLVFFFFFFWFCFFRKEKWLPIKTNGKYKGLHWHPRKIMIKASNEKKTFFRIELNPDQVREILLFFLFFFIVDDFIVLIDGNVWSHTCHTWIFDHQNTLLKLKSSLVLLETLFLLILFDLLNYFSLVNDLSKLLITVHY